MPKGIIGPKYEKWCISREQTLRKQALGDTFNNVLLHDYGELIIEKEGRDVLTMDQWGG